MEGLRDAAEDAGDSAKVELLDELLRILSIQTFTTSRSIASESGLADTTAKLGLWPSGAVKATEVATEFHIQRVLDLYRDGADADRSAGYIRDLPSGIQGVVELWIHDAAHGLAEVQLNEKFKPIRGNGKETAADTIVNRVYE